MSHAWLQRAWPVRMCIEMRTLVFCAIDLAPRIQLVLLYLLRVLLLLHVLLAQQKVSETGLAFWTLKLRAVLRLCCT